MPVAIVKVRQIVPCLSTISILENACYVKGLGLPNQQKHPRRPDGLTSAGGSRLIHQRRLLTRHWNRVCQLRAHQRLNLTNRSFYFKLRHIPW